MSCVGKNLGIFTLIDALQRRIDTHTTLLVQNLALREALKNLSGSFQLKPELLYLLLIKSKKKIVAILSFTIFVGL